ncbi:hypothetical protein IL992_44050 [Microbispora sp. NEAU-D428]|uniref:hypothetical protein n=1 Tax=Microbispora sitophila TaxID=2771537 RepID=UPI0018681A2D|nr:hypothetical protein [Microbispora sitophila]MBE3016074.1 hypothetical protein [Microbispora sitophila]
MRAALGAFDRITEWNTHWGTARLIVSDANVDVARGFVWAATLLQAKTSCRR